MSTKKEFLNTVRAYLSTLYPAEQGWELSPGKDWKGYKVDFVLERREDKKRIRKVVKAIPRGIPTVLEIKHINMAARRMSGRYVRIEGKILALPEDQEPHGIESDFEAIQIPGAKRLTD